jgi:hypothetical protein
MKTWRERAVEAEARGHWLDEDVDLWRDIKSCPAAEVAAHYGMDTRVHNEPGWADLWSLGNMMGRLGGLVSPRLFLRYLDRIEDRAWLWYCFRTSSAAFSQMSSLDRDDLVSRHR